MVIKTHVPNQTWEDFKKSSGFSKMTKREWIKKGLPMKK